MAAIKCCQKIEMNTLFSMPSGGILTLTDNACLYIKEKWKQEVT